MGSILLPVKQTDLDKLDAILSNSTFQTPNIKLSIYKNRRGKYKGIYLWCDAHLDCCRVKPIFCTTYDYELIKVDDLKIITDDESAF